MLHDASVARLVEIALAEDIGTGDVTAESTISPESRSVAQFLVKQDGVVCGLPIAHSVLRSVLRALEDEHPALAEESFFWEMLVDEGSLVSAGTVVARCEGNTRALLMAERTALNFLQRMSGVATQTSIYAAAVAGTTTKVIDTRKTIPAWRLLDKYAVVCGGGANHRMGLYDMAMIKDNHRDAAGSITNALKLCNQERERLPEHRRFLIEVETRSLADVREVLQCWRSGLAVHRIMFDNFTAFDVRKGVVLVREALAAASESSLSVQELSSEDKPASKAESKALSKAVSHIETEASGGITLHSIRNYAEAGVDFISVGALTHSAAALDISMKIVASPS
jgi:nicotinate-nucleotide pyrophosphorylase (carboxylating)